MTLLRAAEGLLPAGRAGVYPADLRARPEHPGAGASGLEAANAEEFGPDECAGAPGCIRSERHDRDGDSAGHSGRRARCCETGAIAGPALPEKRRGNRRTINRAFAGRTTVQPRATP